LATGSSVVSVFDLATGRKIPRESWHGASITCIHGSADETICSGGKDGTVVFSTPGSREHKLAQAHKGRVSAVEYNKKLASFLTAGDDGKIKIWSEEKRMEIGQLSPSRGAITSISLSDNWIIAAAFADASPWVYSKKRDEMLAISHALSERTQIVTFGPAGCLLTVNRIGNKCEIWNIESSLRVKSIDCGSNIRDAKFSPTGSHLYVATNNSIQCWDCVVWQLAWQSPIKSGIRVTPLRQTGTVAVLDDDGRVWLCDFLPDSCKARTREIAMNARAEAICQLNLGRRIAVGSFDSRILVLKVNAPVRNPWRQNKARTETLWGQMRGTPPEALAAMSEMQRLSNVAEFLKSKLFRVDGVDESALMVLIKDLDSPRFQIRDQAYGKLLKAGDVAVPLLKAALGGTVSFEARRRIETLLKKAALPEPQTSQSIRAIHVLEDDGSAEAILLLQDLAKGHRFSRITAEAKRAVERLRASVTDR
jgi:hypothetical protein